MNEGQATSLPAAVAKPEPDLAAGDLPEHGCDQGQGKCECTDGQANDQKLFKHEWVTSASSMEAEADLPKTTECQEGATEKL